MERTSERIRALMAEQHISQKALAAELQVSTSSLSNYLHANRWMSLPLLRRMCQSLHTSCDYLIGLSDQKYPSRLPDDEQLFLELYRQLTPQGKRCALYQLRGLNQLCLLHEHQQNPPETKKAKPSAKPPAHTDDSAC